MEINYLKQLFFTILERNEYCEEIMDELGSLYSDKDITSEEYDIIMNNYDKWLKEWEMK